MTALPTETHQQSQLARSLGTTPTALRDEYRRVTRRARRVVERLFYGIEDTVTFELVLRRRRSLGPIHASPRRVITWTSTPLSEAKRKTRWTTEPLVISSQRLRRLDPNTIWVT